jgi:4-amino-4-deoxy-L-arabinose transferase-like glycosyltransferase
LFDLTNTYFEGQKRNSLKARRGRSKEKRSDAKLPVLASGALIPMVLSNTPQILEGNASDPVSLPDMVEKLAKQTVTGPEKVLIAYQA